MAYEEAREMASGESRGAGAGALQQAGHEAQQHPIGIYLWIWALLFVVSVLSYLTDFMPDGLLKWTLITVFMLLKAGLIVSVFMHMVWERMAIICAILLPPGVLLVLMSLMALEADYTLWTRLTFFFN